MTAHDTISGGMIPRDGSDPLSREYIGYRKKLLAYCIHVIGDPESAKDIVQDSFLQLLEKTRDERAPDRPRDWLFICARNRCFKHLRSKRGRERHSALPEPPPATASVDDARVIEQILSRLEAEERDLILVREVLQYSIREIATLLGITEEAVRVRLHRVRKKMHELGRM